MSAIVAKYSGRFREGRDLIADDAEPLLDSMIVESDEILLADLFRTWNEKGITENEIYQIARIMRERCTRVKTRHEGFLDIVGTGGSRAKTFNVSTAAAFVIAGAGVPVAKHGNRAATTSTGSADVLSALGVEPAVDAATAERCLDEIGICFMFAPNFHRLSPTLAKVRRGLGFPTIFNCVGPLCNPASAPHQLIGVWSEEMVPKMANALARLGTQKAWVVYGRDGLDEISLTSTTYITEIEGGKVTNFEISAADFGLTAGSLNSCRVSSAAESAGLIKSILGNHDPGSSAESVVVMNSAAALYLSGQAATLNEGVGLATASIRSGESLSKVAQLAEAVKK